MSDFIPVSPESVGISSDRLAGMVSKLAALDTLHGIMVLRHGKLCLSAFWKPFEPDMPHMLYSLSKSFTSSAIGYARSENLLHLSDKLCSFFPEYDADVTDPVMRTVTLRDLLTMRSGHNTCTVSLLKNAPDGNWVRAYLGSKLTCKPGTHFVYNSGASYMLAAVIRKLTGQNVREYLMPRLFEPLGIIPGVWECCPMGINFGGWGLSLKTEDIAKFSQLLLNRGKWNGKQIFPEDYLTEATVIQADNSMNESPDWKCGYGYQFWMSQHGYRGDGASGQYAIVMPEQDIAIATNSSVSNMQDILTILWDHLIDGLSDTALPENPEGQARLASEVAKLAIPCAQGNLEKRGNFADFVFKPNSANILSASVEFDRTSCALSLRYANGSVEQFRAGFGHFRVSSLALYDPNPHFYAASAAWIAENVLEIQTFTVDGTFRDTYRIDFDDKKTPLSQQCRGNTFRPGLPVLELAD